MLLLFLCAWSLSLKDDFLADCSTSCKNNLNINFLFPPLLRRSPYTYVVTVSIVALCTIQVV